MTTTILPSRSPYGSPAYSPNSRPVYYGGATGPAAPAGYALSFAALGITTSGFIFDGAASAFCTDSAGTTACSASGSDPVGYIEDMSGNGNHLIQTSSPSKPVYYTNNGVNAFRSGSMPGSRWMRPTTDLYVTSAHTVFAVYRLRETVNNGGVLLCTYTDNSWGSGGYFKIGNAQGSDAINYVADFSASGFNVFSAGAGQSKLVEAVRSTLANTSVYSYNSAGVLQDSVVGNNSQGANPANKITVGGYDTTACDVIETAFLMYVNAALDSTQRDTVLNYMVANFGAWV